MRSPRDATRVASVTNRDFLDAVFGSDWPRAHVTAFDADPSALRTQNDQRHAWAGGPARNRLVSCTSSRNTYYCVSLFHPGEDARQRRRKAAFDALRVVVFDDVGHGPSAKVDPAKIIARGILPSYRLETSPGNEQWGFILATPETDRGRAEALIDGLIASGLVEGNRDPGQSGVTRYVRLPVGTNRKAKYGPGGFRHRLVEWRPDRRVSIEDMAHAWGIDLSNATNGTRQDGALAASAGEMAAQNRRNLTFRLLEELGMVREELGEPGKYSILCPFWDLHTDGDETGTAWLPRRGIIYCHHSHGVGGDNDNQDTYLRRLEEMLLEDGRGHVLRDLRYELAALDFQDADDELCVQLMDMLRAGHVPDAGAVKLAALTLSPQDIRMVLDGAIMFADGGEDVDTAVRQFRSLLAQERRRLRALRATSRRDARPPSPALEVVSLAEAEAHLDTTFDAAFAHLRGRAAA